jgi:dipeptidyl aminopeptidase/acylaminoacyl peptidase
MGRRGEHPEAAVWLVPSDGAERARKLTSGAVNDRSPRWSPDGRWLYFLSDRSERGEAQLYRMPAQKSGEAEALTRWKAGIGSFVPLPDGESVAFLAKDEPDEEDERRERERDDAEVFGERWPYARLRLLEIGTGKIRTVEALGERHVVEVAPHPSGTSLAVVSWPTPELDNWSRENAVHEVSMPGLETRQAATLGADVYELAWGKPAPAGPRLFAVAAGPGGVGEAVLHEVSLEQGGDGPRMLEGDLPACPAGVRRGGAPEADPLVTVAEGLDTWVGHLRTEEENLEELSRHSGLLHSLDADAGGKIVAALRSTSEEPLEVWAGPPEGPLRRLTDLNPGLREAAFGRQERLSWRAPDGLGFDGLLILPPGETREGGPFPLVALVHGGPYGRWADCLHLNWAFSGHWLADGGYATFLPNPRGGQGHGRRFAASVAGAVGTGDYSDVISGVEMLVDEGVADPNRLGIGGWSQGGYMAAWAVGQTERFKAAVMGAGISDLGGMVAEGDIPTFELALGGSAGWEGPGPHHHDELSPISHAHRVSTPVLIFHGENDERVPLGQARYFARALRAHGCPFEFVVYPREPHVLQERNHQLDVLRRARAWFDRWLGANDGHGAAADQAGGYGR